MQENSNSGVSIAMMTTFSGSSFKAPQLQSLLLELEKNGMLADSFGIWSSSDNRVYSVNIQKKLSTPKLMKYLISLNSRICRILKLKCHYTNNEKIYGFFARFHRFNGKYVLVKPRPVSLIKYFKRKNKIIIVEASENHTRYTKEQIEKECMDFGIPVVKSNYTKENVVSEYEEGIKLSDYIICLSDFSAETYVKYGIPTQKIFVTGIKTGFVPKFEKIDLNQPVQFICIAGNHKILKGTHRLIKVWNDYNIQNKLILVGMVSDEIFDIFDKSHLNKNIKFIGSVSREWIQTFYCKNKSVCILLSLSESYGRVVHEALCCATPVMVTQTCTCDIVESGVNGYVVKLHDEKQIYDMIQTYIGMSDSMFENMRYQAFLAAAKMEEDKSDSYLKTIKKIINIEESK